MASNLKSHADASELNSPEQDVEAFRQLCLKERDEQLKVFEQRWANKLGKDGVMECDKVAGLFNKRAGNSREIAVKSTEFTSLLDENEMTFASMQERAKAFKSLDIDGNSHVSLVEFLIFLNKEMILSSSEERWGVAPPKDTEDPEGYQAAVLREFFLPASGYDKGFDNALVDYVTKNEANIAKKAELEASKEGVSGVKARNIDQDIKKVEQAMEADKKDFDRDLPKVAKIAKKSEKKLADLKAEITADAAASEKAGRGGVNKGFYEGK